MHAVVTLRRRRALLFSSAPRDDDAAALLDAGEAEGEAGRLIGRACAAEDEAAAPGVCVEADVAGEEVAPDADVEARAPKASRSPTSWPRVAEPASTRAT